MEGDDVPGGGDVAGGGGRSLLSANRVDRRQWRRGSLYGKERGGKGGGGSGTPSEGGGGGSRTPFCAPYLPCQRGSRGRGLAAGLDYLESVGWWVWGWGGREGPRYEGIPWTRVR